MALEIQDRTEILVGVFVAALIAANLLGTKITTILGISMSVGIFAYPITFLITDVIEEVHGRKVAKRLIYAGLISLLLVMVLTLVSLWLPAASRFENNDAYTLIFSSSARIILASIVAFLLSQTHDVWSFEFWKKKTKGRHLWLRNNLSTMVSQAIDTVIFMFIAFYHVTPKFDVPFLISLIIPYWLLKVLMAALDTPFVYLGVWWLRGRKPKPAKK
ncbi:MAG: queuosine precursor transporter [archaeon]